MLYACRIVSHMEHKVFSEDEVFISSMMHYFTKMMTEEIELSESVSLKIKFSCFICHFKLGHGITITSA